MTGIGEGQISVQTTLIFYQLELRPCSGSFPLLPFQMKEMIRETEVGPEVPENHSSFQKPIGVRFIDLNRQHPRGVRNSYVHKFTQKQPPSYIPFSFFRSRVPLSQRTKPALIGRLGRYHPANEIAEAGCRRPPLRSFVHRPQGIAQVEAAPVGEIEGFPNLAAFFSGDLFRSADADDI